MRKFLIVLKLEPLSDNQTTQDHIVAADGIEIKEANFLHLYRWNMRVKSSQESVAFYSLDHVICVVEATEIAND